MADKKLFKIYLIKLDLSDQIKIVQWFSLK